MRQNHKKRQRNEENVRQEIEKERKREREKKSGVVREGRMSETDSWNKIKYNSFASEGEPDWEREVETDLSDSAAVPEVSDLTSAFNRICGRGVEAGTQSSIGGRAKGDH